MNGFGFIEYKDAMDARDVVPGKCMPVCSEGLLANEASLFSHSSFPYVEDPRRIPLMSATTPPRSQANYNIKDGSDFMGERLTVQFARGNRHREQGGGGSGYNSERNAPPRPRRTPHRMQISGLPNETSWQVR